MGRRTCLCRVVTELKSFFLEENLFHSIWPQQYYSSALWNLDSVALLPRTLWRAVYVIQQLGEVQFIPDAVLYSC